MEGARFDKEVENDISSKNLVVRQATSGNSFGRTISTNASAVKTALREYYFNYSRMIESPDQLEKREFGYSHFGASGMLRHMSFKNIGELIAILIKEVPSDVYCSNAYYRFPTAPMQEKEWLGADLIFDIDGKDLNLPCVPSHTFVVCNACGKVSPPKLSEDSALSDIKRANNLKPGQRSVCEFCKDESKTEQVSIPCNDCVKSSKNQAKRLFDMLAGDLGIDKESISIYFSGNNGFHLHVSDKNFATLDSHARSDIASYLSGSGFMTESIGVRRAGEKVLIRMPRSGLDYGWRNRVAKKLNIDNRSILRLDNLVKREGGYDGFKSSLGRLVREMGAVIDPHVTIDVHRIFRMPGTINSKSGLSKVKCTGNLDSFNPFVDACLLGDTEITLKTKTPLMFRMKGKKFDLKKESASLPGYAAVYLICKRLADVV